MLRIRTPGRQQINGGTAIETQQHLTEAWERDGCLLLENFFDDEEIAELRSITDEFVEKTRMVTSSDDVFDLDPSHSADQPCVRRIKTPDAQHDIFRRFARHDRLVEVLSWLLPNGVRLEVGKINLKPPNADGGIAWHQDYPFSPLTNDDSAAVGIFLDDVDDENGPLLVVPGSHRKPLLSHHRDGKFVGCVETNNAEFQKSEVRALKGTRGSITIHHCRTLHASGPNRSDKTRRIYFNQYHAIDAWPYMGVTDMDWWLERRLAGEEMYAPRVTMTDVRLPLPVDPYGSIFEVQGDAAFDDKQYSAM